MRGECEYLAPRVEQDRGERALSCAHVGAAHQVSPYLFTPTFAPAAMKCARPCYGRIFSASSASFGLPSALTKFSRDTPNQRTSGAITNTEE